MIQQLQTPELEADLQALRAKHGLDDGDLLMVQLGRCLVQQAANAEESLESWTLALLEMDNYELAEGWYDMYHAAYEAITGKELITDDEGDDE